jgi:DNA uptake protein ComE-like DNA-binding protein
MKFEAARVRAHFPAIAVMVICALLMGCPMSRAEQLSGNHVIPPPEARVDINSASVTELLKVPGMTQTWAGRIVRFRPYHSKNELVERGVVTGEVYSRIKDYVIAHRHRE